MMFDQTMNVTDLLMTYSAVLVPVIVSQFIFLIGYLIQRIKRG